MAKSSPGSPPVSSPPYHHLQKQELTLLADSGVAQGWGTATECQSAACGSYAAHEYINTKIVMDVADPNYADTKGVTGASGDLVTADGGKTWTVESIKIEAGVFE